MQPEAETAKKSNENKTMKTEGSRRLICLVQRWQIDACPLETPLSKEKMDSNESVKL